jgi:tRNA threonylcarbamoyladenosine biosynthesis protein TsaE
LDDYLYGGGVCVIEWAEKGLTFMPPDYLLIKIDYLGDTKRNLEFEARGDRYKKILDMLKVDTD